MQARWPTAVGGGVSLVSMVAAATVALLLSRDVVQGPVVGDGPAAAIIGATAVLLGTAAAATSLVLPRADFAWHADGIACCVLVLCLAAGVVVGWEHGPDPLRVLALVVTPLAVPAMLDVVERRVRGARTWTLISAAVVGALSVGRYLVRDPFRDPDCWADCSLQDVAPLPSQMAARLVDTALDIALWTVAAVAVGLVLVAWRAREDRSTTAVLDLGIAALAAIAAVLAGLALLPSDRDSVAKAALVAIAAQAVVGLLVALQPARAVRRRHDLRRLALDLGDVPELGTLEQTLARALGDPGLKVAYWLPESGRYVDSHGDPVDTTMRWSISLQRGDESLALIHLEQSDREADEVAELIGSATRLAIDSERLQAELRAQLSELQASRQRIVAAADDTRRNVERSLHDIVQAELLGALFELARVKSEAERNGEAPVAHKTAMLADQVRTLVGRLREFARGIYPAVLDASGLPTALGALADEAPVVVRFSCRLDKRPPAKVERAAYLLIHDAVMEAHTDLDVDVSWAASELVVQISDHADQVRVDLVDRVGALGGTVVVDEGVFRAVLPCG